jgi:hypothetical protein
MQAQCVIETHEPNEIVEVMLDGKLIYSGKTSNSGTAGNLQRCVFATRAGNHQLVVSASGYELWEKKICLVGGSNEFWAKLKKK